VRVCVGASEAGYAQSPPRFEISRCFGIDSASLWSAVAGKTPLYFLEMFKRATYADAPLN